MNNIILKQLKDLFTIPNPFFRFGTLSDYFSEVRGRSAKFDTLSGDFFVYSDIFTDGVPAYWSGYFSTR